jgi:hypothetical protein
MARRGRKRALVAVQHSILIAVWHMFTNDMAYCDLGANYFIERAGKAGDTRRLIGQLNALCLKDLDAQNPARHTARPCTPTTNRTLTGRQAGIGTAARARGSGIVNAAS